MARAGHAQGLVKEAGHLSWIDREEERQLYQAGQLLEQIARRCKVLGRADIAALCMAALDAIKTACERCHEYS